MSTMQSNDVNRDETLSLIASDKVEGTSVYNLKGESLGKIHNFMVDKVSGHVSYAVLSFGGILGIGSSYYPIPWQKLHYDKELSGYVVDIDRDALEGAPSYASDTSPDWLDPHYGRSIDNYYGNDRVA